MILALRMATQKLDVEKFTRENDFHLWRFKMRDLLVDQGIEEVLEDSQSSKKARKIKEEDLQDTMDKAHNTIILSLGGGVLREAGESNYSYWSLEEIERSIY